jgi:hypothetical protein
MASPTILFPKSETGFAYFLGVFEIAPDGKIELTSWTMAQK